MSDAIPLPPEPPPPYEHPAAGWGALWSSLTHVIKNRGAFRNALSLLRVNQDDVYSGRERVLQ